MIFILVPTFDRVKETKFFLDSLNKSIKEEYKVILIDDHPDKITVKNIQQTNDIKIITSKKD